MTIKTYQQKEYLVLCTVTSRLLVSICIILVSSIGGRGRIKMASASAPLTMEPVKRPQFSAYSTAKTSDKSTFLRKNGL